MDKEEVVSLSWLKEQTPDFRRKWLKNWFTAKEPVKRDFIKSLGFPWPPPRGWTTAFINQIPLRQAVQEKQPKKSKKRLREEKKKKRRERTIKKDSFLQSYEWRRLRYMAIKEHGGHCQACGAGPNEGAVLNVDHIKPRKRYPELALVLSNLQVLCSACNHGKGNWDSTDWRP